MSDEKPQTPVTRKSAGKRRPRKNFRERNHRLRLSYDPPAGDVGKYEYRWARGTVSRIAELEEAGYVVVEGDNSPSDEYSGTQRRVGTRENGEVEMGVLMRIPIEYYEEDRALEREAAMAPMEELQRTKGRTGPDSALSQKDLESDKFQVFRA